MTRATNEKLYLTKSFLFVDDEPAICASVKRISKIYGVNVQIANSASVAVSLLEHSPNEYFLILTDELMPGMSGTELLMVVQQRWPHIRRALISGANNPEVLQKGYDEANIFCYLQKPVSDPLIKQLIEDACEDYLLEKRSHEQVIKSRLAILEKTIKQGFSKRKHQALFKRFSKAYLANCRSGWKQAGLYQVDASTLDSAIYENYLTQRCLSSIEKIDKKITGQTADNVSEFKLSASLRQFGIRGLKQMDRYVEGNEAIFVAMLATLKDYYLILGLPISKMIAPQSTCVDISLGGRFTYNDFFNPLLSSVERGVELACLQLEFLMLACLFGVETEMDFSEKISIRILL